MYVPGAAAPNSSLLSPDHKTVHRLDPGAVTGGRLTLATMELVSSEDELNVWFYAEENV